MPLPPAVAFPRLTSLGPPPSSPAASFAHAHPPGEARSAAVATLDAAVRAYVARCKDAGMSSEQVLIRVSDVTRRHATMSLRPAHAVALRDVVFCAFLVAFYGDGRVRCRPAARVPDDVGAPGRGPTVGHPRAAALPVRRDSRTRRS
jgi:hypothetical protein